MNKITTTPKAFISYSWTSEEHEQWVIALAETLRNAGVDAILDKWDLHEGQDKYVFMEQMVSNPEISKVLIICDKEYAKKANERKGGVGTETQIISPEIYAKHDQNKFVAIIKDTDDNGNPYLPIYYKSRKYIDLSTSELYATNFEQLLRWIYDKPLFIKPPLGKTPSFLSEEDRSSLGITALFHRAVEAIRNNRPYRSGALSEYLRSFSANFEILRIPSNTISCDEFIVDSIEKSLPIRNEFIQIIFSLAEHGILPDEQRSIHRFFEHLYPYMDRPKHITSYNNKSFDNYRFIVHELLLYTIAILIAYERFVAIAMLLRDPYYIDNPPNGRAQAVSFASFYVPIQSLIDLSNDTIHSRLSLRSDYLTNRVESSGLSLMQLLQADFTLYIRDCLNSLRNNKAQRWRT